MKILREVIITITPVLVHTYQNTHPPGHPPRPGKNQGFSRKNELGYKSKFIILIKASSSHDTSQFLARNCSNLSLGIAKLRIRFLFKYINVVEKVRDIFILGLYHTYQNTPPGQAKSGGFHAENDWGNVILLGLNQEGVHVTNVPPDMLLHILERYISLIKTPLTVPFFRELFLVLL